jgi:hypothetical protein
MFMNTAFRAHVEFNEQITCEGLKRYNINIRALKFEHICS